MASFPRVTIKDNPTPATLAKSSIADELPPLWDSSATGPASLGSPGIDVTGIRVVKLAKPR